MFVLIFCMIFLVGTISAFEFDNVKSYDLDRNEITITNAFGLGEILAKYKLTDNTYICLNNCFAEGEAVLSSSGRLFNSLDFRDGKRDLVTLSSSNIFIEVNQSYQIVVQDYKEVCALDKNNTISCINEITGDHSETEYRIQWSQYNGEILDVGSYKWRIEGTKEINENIDWIGSAFGEEFSEWAWWNTTQMFQRQINFTTGDAISNNFTHRAIFDRIPTMGDSCQNMTIVYKDTTEVNTDLRVCNTTSVEIAWQEINNLGAGIFDNNISVYYGAEITRPSDNNLVYQWNDDMTISNSSKYGTFVSPGSFGGGVVDITANLRSDIIGNILFTKNFTIEMRVNMAGNTAGQLFMGIDTGQAWNGDTPYVTLGGNANRILDANDGSSASGGTVIGGGTSGFFNYSISVNDTRASATQDNLSLAIPFVDNLQFATTTGMGAGWTNADDSGTKSIDFIRIFEDVNNRPLYTLGEEEEVVQIVIVTTLVSPNDLINTIDTSIFFNSSFTIGNGNFTNSTIYIYNSDGSTFDTNTSDMTGEVSNTSSISVGGLPIGTLLWNNLACGTNSSSTICEFSGNNRTFSITNFAENSFTFNNQTIEGALEDFSANITLTSGVTVIQATFIYDDKRSGADSFISGPNLILNKTDFLIPNTASAIGFNFTWELIFSDNNIANLTFHNQTVIPLFADDCTIYNVRLFNFTIVDEELQTKIIQPENTTLETALNIFSFDRSSLVLNFSNSFNNTNPVALCLSQNITEDIQYSLDLIIRYDAKNHANEYYNIVNSTLTSSTPEQNITLFDLADDDSTDFQLTFKGSDFVAVEGALVNLKRQYISENQFKTVELPVTDSNGQTILHMVRNDVVYTIEITKGGSVLGIFSNIIAFCEDFSIGNCQINLNAFSSAQEIFNYDEDIGLIFSNPTFNNDTRLISFNYVTSDGTAKRVDLGVTRNDVFGNSSICNNTLTSSGGTLNCQVPDFIDDSTLIIEINVDGRPAIIDNIIINSQGIAEVGGYFIAFIFMLSFILMFMESKSVTLIGILLGFITVISLGLLEGKIVGLGASGIWLIVIVLLMLWKLNRKRPD